jgi:hypothetical protein
MIGRTMREMGMTEEESMTARYTGSRQLRESGEFQHAMRLVQAGPLYAASKPRGPQSHDSTGQTDNPLRKSSSNGSQN